MTHSPGSACPSVTAVRCCDPVQLGLRWALAVSYLTAIVTPEGGAAHVWAGAMLGLCLVLRLLWGVIGPQSAALGALWLGRAEIALQLSDLARGEQRFDLGPSPLGAVLSLVLLAMLALVVLSGAALALGGARGGTEAIHEALALGFHVALAAYLAGVVWASLHYRANLVLTLLTGVKPLPDDLYWHNGPDHDAATAHPRAGNPGATPERRVFRRRRHI